MGTLYSFFLLLITNQFRLIYYLFLFFGFFKMVTGFGGPVYSAEQVNYQNALYLFVVRSWRFKDTERVLTLYQQQVQPVAACNRHKEQNIRE